MDAMTNLCGRAGKHYRFQSSLGEGAMGQVYLCQCSNGAQVVVKQVRISSLSQQEQVEAINEVKVMQELSHANIVRYIECIHQDGNLYIVMEYCRYGDLSGLIASRKTAGRPFTEQEIMFWFVQIALALWKLHSKGILHRDLKSQNIFIAEGAIVKLGDFGIARVLNSETELVKTVIGTPYYLSPEIVLDKPYNRKSDCWALGCVLYELSSLRRAFDGGSLPALVIKILRGRYPPLPSRYSRDLRGLVDALLQQDPQARPSIDAVLRMPYVKVHLARYAQHVMKLSHTQDTHGVSAEVVAAAVEGAGSPLPNSAGSQKQVGHGEAVAVAAVAAAASSEGNTVLGKPAAGDQSIEGCMPELHADGSPIPGAAEAQQPNFASASTVAPPADTGQVDGRAGSCQMQSGQSEGSTGDHSTVMLSSGLVSSVSSNADLSRRNSMESSRAIEDDGSDADDDSSGKGVCDTTRQAPISSGAPADVMQRHEKRRGLLATGWLEQQQTALDQLQAQVAALPARSPQALWPPDCAAAAAVVAARGPTEHDDSQPPALPAALQQPMHDVQIAQQLPAPGLEAAATPAESPLKCKAPCSKQQPSSKKKSGGSTKPSGSRAVHHAARRAAALSPAEVIRKQRAAWRQQQAKDAAEEATRRAARAARLAAALQEKTALQAKQQQESASAAAAHRQQMKAVQARIPKGHLAELGAAFMHRLAEQLDTAAASGVVHSCAYKSMEGEKGVADSSHFNDNGELVVLQNSEEAPALLCDGTEAAGSAVVSHPQISRRTACRAGKSVQGGVAVSAAASVATNRSAFLRSTPERERSGAGRLTPGEKPWKAPRHKSMHSTEPEVEIFAPYGTTLMIGGQQLPTFPERQQQQQQPAELTFAGGLCPLQLQVESDGCTAAAMKGNSPQMQSVLTQIQTALAEPASFDSGGADAFDLLPEMMERPAAVSHSIGEGILGQMGVQLASQCIAGCAAQTPPLAQRIEALRCRLEEALGQEVMLQAYRYVEAMQQPSTGAPGAMDLDITDAQDAADPSYELLLQELLGLQPQLERMHMVHQIHKLLHLESQAY